MPRLIAAWGSDRTRYESAAQMQCHSGIAPVTRASGQSGHVNKRIAGPKFLRQTFHEFAGHGRKGSGRPKAFDRMKRAADMKRPPPAGWSAAVRALACKSIRIIFRPWKTRTPYSEAAYLQ